jgi:GNAT superfamily N-acetyltransferase
MPIHDSIDGVRLVEPSSRAQFEQARELMNELMAWDCAQVSELGLDSALVQSFYYSQDELKLPGDYARPDGCLLVALDGSQPAGCGAFSRSKPDVCELKRFYVRGAYRGKQIGSRIAAALTIQARQANYRRIRLETVIFMKSAIAMYRRLGFQDCEPYYEIPQVFRHMTLFMDMAL